VPVPEVTRERNGRANEHNLHDVRRCWEASLSRRRLLLEIGIAGGQHWSVGRRPGQVARDADLLFSHCVLWYSEGSTGRER
jgi:hypothetical protein